MFSQAAFALFLSLFVFSFTVRAQQECAPPKIVANANNAANLFSPEQEMIFGDLTIERMAGDIRLVRDERLIAYVNEIGERLVRHLPPTGLKYKFHIMDIPEANAFNIPGGHIFISRKMIAFAANEDELAGVIAHELGHAVVRHAASDMSVLFKKILNVTSLGDRRDIAEKYNRLIENARTKKVSRSGGHENEQQMEADKIGLFAMVAAGYDATAFSSLFDRLTETKGKTGGWFSDFFGNTRPEQRRLREIIGAAESLPPTCREGRSAQATENFLKWQADVVSFRSTGRKEELPGLLWKKELAPKLRSDISYLAFSHNGKYLLAQDDFAVTIIEREPQPRVLFQIPAEDADPAGFTPDGEFVVFTTESLRYEKWNVPEKKPVEVRELVLRRDCWEHRLSPDGKYLACIDTSTNINLIDTKTGKKVWEKKNFYPLTSLEVLMWLTRTLRGGDRTSLFRIEFSPDARYAMLSRSDRHRHGIRLGEQIIAGSEDKTLAIDLTTLKPVEVKGDLKKLSERPFIFINSEKILGNPTGLVEDAGIFSFPDGKRLQKFAFAAREIKLTGSDSQYAVVKPLMSAQMGVFDLKKASLATAMNKADAALWNNLMAFESVTGKIRLQEVTRNEVQNRFDVKEIGTIDIPVSSLHRLNAAAVSNSFKWLLMSSKTRGGLWNLETGERKVFVRGFGGAAMTDEGVGVGAFPKLDQTPNSLVAMNGNTDQVFAIRELPDKGAQQYGRFVLIRRSLKEPLPNDVTSAQKDSKDNPPQKQLPPGLAAWLKDLGADESELRQEVKFELKDLVKDQVIWTRDFPKQAPRYSFDEKSGRLIFYWSLDSEIGKAKLAETPGMQAKADAVLGADKSNDYLVEVIDAFAQKTVGAVLVETGKGSFYVASGLSERNWLIIYDSEGRVLVYSLADGNLRHRFFGRNAALNPGKNQLAVENFPGEVTLYNLESGEAETNFIIGGKASFVAFNLEGTKMFVLSDAQTAYAFDLNKTKTPAAP